MIGKALRLCLLLVLCKTSVAQRSIECAGLREQPVRLLVQIDGASPKASVSKTELMKHGLSIRLDDNAAELIGFNLTYDCQSSDINAKAYYTATVKPNDKYLKGIQEGNLLGIECVNIRIGKAIYTIPPIIFKVVK